MQHCFGNISVPLKLYYKLVEINYKNFVTSIKTEECLAYVFEILFRTKNKV